MRLYEREWQMEPNRGDASLIAAFGRAVAQRLAPGEHAVRFVVAESDGAACHCEVGILATATEAPAPFGSIFDFRKRSFENADAFNVVLLVPTGVHAELGGHAGDAGPVARLVAGCCDRLITHPNVVNASDINEMPDNALYVEGSAICRFLMGTASLRPVRANRVILAIDKHEEESFTTAAINSYNAARACYGLNGPRVVVLDPPVKLVSEYTSSGRAAGRVDNFGEFITALKPFAAECDALAISSVIQVPPEFHQDYFDSDGTMVNPWGGVEAIFTHAITLLRNIPSAHSPMLESLDIEEIDPGIVDPRLAAEAVSYTFLQSVLKGLMRSPAIVIDPSAMSQRGVLGAGDVAALVTPDGCLGLPVLAALEQGIRVVAVRDRSVLVRNDLTALPWAPGQFEVVDSYLEAVGVLTAWREGLALESVRRPIATAAVTRAGGTTRRAKSPRVAHAGNGKRSAR